MNAGYKDLTGCGCRLYPGSHYWPIDGLGEFCESHFKSRPDDRSEWRKCDRCGTRGWAPHPSGPHVCGNCIAAQVTCPWCKSLHWPDRHYVATLGKFCTQDHLQRARGEAWYERIPPGYRDTSVRLLPDLDATQTAGRHLRRMSAIQRDIVGFPNRQERAGLFLWGKSGGGKTRSLYRMLRPVTMRHEFEIIAGGWLGNRVRSLITPASGGGDPDIEALEEWKRELVDMPLLAIDEFDAAGFSDGVTRFLFDLIEARSHDRWTITILVSNSTPDELLRRIRTKSEKGEPLVRRLKEFFTPIKFTPNPRTT